MAQQLHHSRAMTTSQNRDSKNMKTNSNAKVSRRAYNCMLTGE